jgi:cell shape-determining protein MreD
LLLQASVIAPAVVPVPISLPAVLVAAIALVDGPATGMSFGFAAGLVADLGSAHPAGVLALCWLGVGLIAGRAARPQTLRGAALTAGVVCGVASAAATVLLALVNSAGSVHDAVLYAVPAAAGDAVVAVGVLALVRRMLGSDTLRAPHPVYTELVLDARRG